MTRCLTLVIREMQVKATIRYDTLATLYKEPTHWKRP